MSANIETISVKNKSQISQDTVGNNVSNSNIQNVMGQTVLDTVYPLQAQNVNASLQSQQHKSTNPNEKDNVIKSHVSKNSNIQYFDNVRTPNKSSQIITSQVSQKGTQFRYSKKKTILKDGKTLTNIDPNDDEEDNESVSNSKCSNNLANIPTVNTVDLQNQQNNLASTINSQKQNLSKVGQTKSNVESKVNLSVYSHQSNQNQILNPQQSNPNQSIYNSNVNLQSQQSLNNSKVINSIHLQNQSVHSQISQHSQNQSIHSQISQHSQNQSISSRLLQNSQQIGSSQLSHTNSQIRQTGQLNETIETKILMKNSLKESRNKSPPQLMRTSDGNIKATSNDTNGNSFIIKADEEKKMSQIKNSRHLDDILNKKIEKTVIQDAKSGSHKKGKGYRYYGKLTIDGKNQNGKAKINQDTSLIHLNVGDISGFNLFGVLDGHGQNGQNVSQFCNDYFIRVMNRYAELCIKSKLTTAEAIYKELKRTNFAYIIDAYNKADVYLGQQKAFDCNFNGTTCNIVFQFNNHLVCANVGDSRGIVVYDEGNKQNKGIFPLSTDHKPDLPEESERIKSHGGVIEQFKDSEGKKVGPLRIWKAGKNYPGLAMTRTLGDFKAKEAGVIPTPEITEYTINHNSKFMVICSDGVWEFINNEHVRDMGNPFFMKNDVGGFCTNLVKSAMENWEQLDIMRDDITVVCVFF